MEEMVTIPKKEYEELKRRVEKKSAIAKEIAATVDDLKNGRAHEITDPEDI